MKIGKSLEFWMQRTNPAPHIVSAMHLKDKAPISGTIAFWLAGSLRKASIRRVL
jgi:hypothetical protein